jgi:ABC-type transport system substrate-binding protein
VARSYWDRLTRQRVARRRVLQAGGSLALGLTTAALIGCGGDDDDDGSTGSGTGAQTGSTAGEPKAGGAIRVGMLSDLTSLNPHVFITDHTDTIWQIWERLTEYDEDLNPQGRLAQNWEINDDSTEFVFHLRPNVKWHSGRDVTSEDVRFNLMRVRDPAAGFALLKTMSEWYETIETPDPQTVILKSSIPRPATFDFLEFLNIADTEVMESGDASKAGGTGPFMFGEWRPGDRFNLLKNPDYWDSGLPYLDEQVFSVALDPQTMVTQFESRALEVAKTPPIRDFVRLREDSGYQTLVHGASGAYYAVGFNTTVKPFDDKRVRQAMQWSIDRERYADIVLQETVEPYTLPWPASSIAYEESKANFYSFDPDKAKSLLDAAGVSNLNMTLLLNPNTPELIEFAELWQADLRDLGVSAEVEVVEVAVFVERINADPPNYNGAWISGSSRANLGSPITMFTSTSVLWDHNGDNNTAFYSDAYKEVIDGIVVESDSERLKQLYSELNDILIDESFIGMLAPRPPRVALQNNLNGVVQMQAHEGFAYKNAWLG